MRRNSTVLERICQVIDYSGIRRGNSFAIDHLKYTSSEKINRLKK